MPRREPRDTRRQIRIVGSTNRLFDPAISLHFKDAVEFAPELFVFGGGQMQGQDFRAFEPRVLRPEAYPAGTTALILKQLLSFEREHEVDENFRRTRVWRILQEGNSIRLAANERIRRHPTDGRSLFGVFIDAVLV